MKAQRIESEAIASALAETGEAVVGLWWYDETKRFGRYASLRVIEDEYFAVFLADSARNAVLVMGDVPIEDALDEFLREVGGFGYLPTAVYGVTDVAEACRRVVKGMPEYAERQKAHDYENMERMEKEWASGLTLPEGAWSNAFIMRCLHCAN